eukprot:GHUV01019319.1.p1 GENE.GHUV01019319.1~~GHUV01019319.1.p1  ORF type:complete len:325 (+),score=111.92 GHUV01019319.1:411-1385(+)
MPSVGARSHHCGVISPWQPASLQHRPAGRNSSVQAVSAAAGTAGTALNNSSSQPPLQQASQQVHHTSGDSHNDLSKPRRQVPKPFLVRIAGRTSDVKAASGAVVKRLRTEDMVRVAAIDAESLPKAMITLTAANRMAQANSGHMLVFQPVLIEKSSAAEPPRVPQGSMVMYTTQIMQGEVMTFNTLRVTAETNHRALAKAIIARIATNSHTVLECYGMAALTVAVQAVAQARKGLLIKRQDIACVITSSSKSATSSSSGTTADATADSSSSTGAAAAQGSGDSSSRAVTCHRLVLLECEPRRPRSLLVTSTVGVSDRSFQQQPS